MDTENTAIKVIGVGGCGCNVIRHMVERGLEGVEFIAINTDANALHRCRATTRLQIGAKGLGADSKPSIGRAAAEEDRERIKELLLGSDMVFITAGMGGGTGSGAAPVVAQIARELNILSVAVVTYPFAFEGNRLRFADEGIKALQQYVDAILIVSNQTSLVSMKKEEVAVPEVFQITHQSIYRLVADMVGMINESGLINIDIADLRSILSKSGMALMGSATASGPDRAKVATERAIENMAISGARGIVVNTTSNGSLILKELDDMMDYILIDAEDATVILSSGFDESMGDELRVTVLATGLSVHRDLYDGDSK